MSMDENEPQMTSMQDDSEKQNEPQMDSHMQEEPQMDKDMQRLQEDSALRRHLGIGSHFTGPKGILADRKFHKEQERNRELQKEQQFLLKLNQQALSSGWMERQLQEESSGWMERQLQEDQIIGTQSGFVTELTVDSYVDAIDLEDPSVLVLIHLYDNTNQYCRIVNEFLVQMAQDYRQCKFYKIPAKEADSNFDSVALPAMLIYKGGDLILSLLRMQDEIPDWASTGRCQYADFCEYITLQDIGIGN